MPNAYGWIQSKPDGRDLIRPELISPPKSDVLAAQAAFPPVFSLRPRMDAVMSIWDQLQLGSCTAHGALRAVIYRAIREGKLTEREMLSRLFVYFNSRNYEGTTATDAGAAVRDALKAVARLGAPPEAQWPYSDQNPGPFQRRPPAAVYKDALKHLALKYYTHPMTRFNNKWCLTNDFPVVFGIPVYNSFESQQVANTGIVPVPAPGEGVAGGHCMAVIGWDDPRQLYEVANSWGNGWGDNGYCWLPYSYFESQASDLWTVRLES